MCEMEGEGVFGDRILRRVCVAGTCFYTTYSRCGRLNLTKFLGL